MLGHAASFKDLVVYRKARVLATSVFNISKSFPREEAYSLTNQIRRSSRSIGAQIAESWGKRRYESHFVSKLTDADSEQYETQHWVDIALDCKFITEEEAAHLNRDLTEIGRMLNGMMEKASAFCCASGVSEPAAVYFTV